MRVAVWCDSHQKIVDEGEISNDSGLLLWNDFTTAKAHLNCLVILRLKSNCPQTTKEKEGQP